MHHWGDAFEKWHCLVRLPAVLLLAREHPVRGPVGDLLGDLVEPDRTPAETYDEGEGEKAKEHYATVLRFFVLIHSHCEDHGNPLH